MHTPHFIPVSSRGAIPHVSQDNMRNHTSLTSMYAALEDCETAIQNLPQSYVALTLRSSWRAEDIEKAPSRTPPVYSMPSEKHESPLRKFIALQKDALLVLGPRRIPPLPCPASSTSTSIAMVTSLGFGMLECAEYVVAVQKLRPDVIVAMGDVVFGHEPGVKRQERMGDRTHSWLNALVAGMNDPDAGTPSTAIFAPILPIEAGKQDWYLSALEENLQDHLSGLVLYESDSLDSLPKSLSSLPRLWLGNLKTPQELLDVIELGVDVFALPFINQGSECGFAFNFAFGAREAEAHEDKSYPLALDMWSDDHATDLSSLSDGCQCYTCVNHHKAYVRHLLNANEMLSWVLLQLHNYHVMDQFFAAVRHSIANATYKEDKAIFLKMYERDWPVKTGQGPR